MKKVNLFILVLNFFQAVPMLPLVVAEDRTTNEILDGFELDRAQLKLVKLLGTELWPSIQGYLRAFSDTSGRKIPER